MNPIIGYAGVNRITYAEIQGKTDYHLGALIIHACDGNNSDARTRLLSSIGIWWGWTGTFDPFFSDYSKKIASHWGYDREEEVISGGVLVTETFGGDQETNQFQIISFEGSGP